MVAGFRRTGADLIAGNHAFHPFLLENDDKRALEVALARHRGKLLPIGLADIAFLVPPQSFYPGAGWQSLRCASAKTSASGQAVQSRM